MDGRSSLSSDRQTFVGEQAAAPVPIPDGWRQGGSTAATGLKREAISAEGEQMNAGLNKRCQGSINALVFRMFASRCPPATRQQLESFEMH